MSTISAEFNRLLTVEELAEKLSVSVQTIYYWVSRDEIPVIKVGRHNRFSFEEVMKGFREKTKKKLALKKPWTML